MFARGAWGWLGWVAATCVVGAVVFHSMPVRVTHPVGTSDRQAYVLATENRFAGMPVQHVVYTDSIKQNHEADGLYLPDEAEVEIRVVDNTLSKADYTEVLRHEYGHALLYTWCVLDSDGDAAFDNVVHFTAKHADALPAELAGVGRDYQADPDLFGAYAKTSLVEWMAEAYVAYMAGEDVPPSVKSFYDGLHTGLRRPLQS